MTARPDHIVGIGASAGGLESLQRFFDRLGEVPGMAFVVIQHLSPDFESLMDELLARHTSLPVGKVAGDTPVQAGRVYLIPPGKDMTVREGILRLSDRSPRDKLSLPIDTFLRSLAADAGSAAVAVILSGTGSDGSRGALAVAERGGLVLAESEASAKFHGMPRAAVETGCVDRILAAEHMGEALQRYASLPGAGGTLLEEQPGSAGELEQILALLRERSGLDFGCYKPATVARRINRRIVLHHYRSLGDYLGELQGDPEELDALYRDLLIGVTRFFRDAQAFEQVGEQIDALVGALEPGEPLRIWSAGCATGEEVYSLLMLAGEAFRRRGEAARVKAFATDVHEAALRIAGIGRYPVQALDGVPGALARRYFETQGDSCLVHPDLRGQVVFARHDLLRDAPFTRMDLVSCRNLLIYFNSEAQHKALNLFHFGLKAGGLLFLGPSEAPAGLEEEFAVLDSRWRLFRKKRDVRLLPMQDFVPYAPRRTARERAARGQELPAQARQLLVESYGPPALLVGRDFRLIHAFAGAGDLLQHQDGQASLDVLELLPAELRFPVSASLQRVRKENRPAAFAGVTLADGRTFDLEVRALHPEAEAGSPLLLVLRPAADLPDSSPRPPLGQADLPDLAAEHIEALEGELAQTRENLQTALEEMETSNEELQATNEELMASNEELQGTNEELHSVNEELYSVNAEYQDKIEELREVTADLNQLLDSAQVHTLFLDRSLRIRRFNDGMARLFDLLPRDEGRSLRTFSHRLLEPDLYGKLERVATTERGIEELVEAADERSFLMRIVPYHRGERSEGVLLTLLDVTDLRSAEEARSRLAGVIDATSDFVGTASPDGRLLAINPGGRAMLGLAPGDPLPADFRACHPEWAARLISETAIPAALRDGQWTGRTALASRDGREIPVSQIVLAHYTEDGEVDFLSTIMRDLSELVGMMDSLQRADERKNEFIAMLAHELRNPLQAIQVCMDLLDSGGAEHLDRARRIIGHQLGQLRRLVDDLMDISRITRGKITLKRGPLDLHRFLEEQLRDGTRFTDGEHDLEAHLGHEALWIDADQARIEQILGNLITNACRYSEAGTTVTVELAGDEDEVRLAVADEGIGLGADELEVIFEPFVQREQGTRSGLGLGLTLIRRLMELHGGQVRADSAGKGEGSRFTVSFPRIHAPAADPREDGGGPSHTALERDVLLVDDNDQALDTLSRLLALRGCRVVTARLGGAALELAAGEHFDAAVVDIGLPDMSGLDVAAALRAREPALKLVAITGYGQVEMRERALAGPFDAFLVKPVGLEELLAVLADETGAQTEPRRDLESDRVEP